jgi:hypothetical protein
MQKAFISSYKVTTGQDKATSVTLDGKILVIRKDDVTIHRISLSETKSLKITTSNDLYYVEQIPEGRIVLWNIQTEADAKRLKKALEHLIAILKTEKNEDPFGG